MSVFSAPARLLVSPFRGYADLANAEEGHGRPTVVGGMLRFLFVFGAFVSLTATGRLAPFELVSGIISFSYVPVLHATAVAIAIRLVAPEVRFARAFALYAEGYGPWFLFMLAIAGGSLFAPDPARLLAATIGWMILIAHLCGGVLFDDAPPRPVVHRAGYLVLEGDFHTHTGWSDGSLSPLGIVRQANRRGIDVVALTEHNTVLPSKAARLYSGVMGGPMVVTGEEVTTFRFHVIALGIESTVSPNQPLEGVIADIHAQHGIAIAAHPVRRYWPALLPMRERLDGAEVMHPVAYSERGEWRWEDMVTFYDESKAPLSAIGSSDYHWMSVLGLCRTLVFVREPASETSVLDALREHHTVTFDRDGKAYGDPALVEALRVEPYAPRTSDYAYRGAGTADRVLRSLGFIGLAGMLLVRARKRWSRVSTHWSGPGRTLRAPGGHRTRRPEHGVSRTRSDRRRRGRDQAGSWCARRSRRDGADLPRSPVDVPAARHLGRADPPSGEDGRRRARSGDGAAGGPGPRGASRGARGAGRATVARLAGANVHADRGDAGHGARAGPGAATADERADVYSLSVILFRAVVGTLPFEAETVMELMVKVTSAPRPRVHARRPDLSPDLDAWVEQALALAPEDRFRSVRATWRALRNCF